MANMCSNSLTFQGSRKAIAQVQQLFQTMRDKEDQTGKGQLPEFLNNEDGYFFDLYWDENDSGVFQYETRWAPNTEIVQEIAQHYKLNFTLDYEEMGSMAYGRISCSEGKLTDISLEAVDFDSYALDFDTGIYHFEGQQYEYDCDILETLLERKINALKKQNL